MRKIIVCIIFLFSLNAYGQSGWFWQNPFPTGVDYIDINFPTDSIGYCVGWGSTLIKTTNSGSNWFFATDSIGLINGNYSGNLQAVSFYDKNTGYVSGNIIGKTVDGGQSWSLAGLNLGSVQDIYCTAPNVLFAVTPSTLFKTTNSGLNWNSIDSGNFAFKKIFFINNQTGFTAGKYIRKTTDGGVTWVECNNYGSFTDITMKGQDTGYAVTFDKKIFRTLNGGTNWFNVYTGPSPYNNYRSVDFINPTTGFVSTSTGVILKTNNMGINWVEKPVGNLLLSICFPTSTIGISVGVYGQIYKTNNSGDDWNSVSSEVGYAGAINQINFPDSINGFAVGNAGIIIRTSNSGLNWNKVSTNITRDLLSVWFLNKDTGFVTGYRFPNYQILRTQNSGQTWDSLTVSGFINHPVFLDNNTGFVTGQSKIFKTTNGGNNWTSENLPGVGGLPGPIDFPDSNTGYLLGRFSPTPNSATIVYKTTNTGNSWNQVSLLNGEFINDMKFINSSTGFLCGGLTYKTTNGGFNWNVVQHTGSKFIDFIDSQTGFILNYKTTNSGVNWYYNPVPYNLTYYLNDLKFLNNNTGFIVGEGGIILKTTNAGGLTEIEPLSQTLPASFSLHQNYPNPFNPSTKIKFDIPKGSPVRLKVYDMLGREVAELVNEKLAAGVYEYEWNGVGLPSGVYFYKLEAENFVETRRMVLVK